MSAEYLIYYVSENGGKMYLTDLPRDDNPLGGIGFQSRNDGSIPDAAGTCPDIHEAEKVIEYLKEACYGEPRDYKYEAVVEPASQESAQ